MMAYGIVDVVSSSCVLMTSENGSERTAGAGCGEEPEAAPALPGGWAGHAAPAGWQEYSEGAGIRTGTQKARSLLFETPREGSD